MTMHFDDNLKSLHAVRYRDETATGRFGDSNALCLIQLR